MIIEPISAINSRVNGPRRNSIPSHRKWIALRLQVLHTGTLDVPLELTKESPEGVEFIGNPHLWCRCGHGYRNPSFGHH
jgi:hypothetical protein